MTIGAVSVAQQGSPVNPSARNGRASTRISPPSARKASDGQIAAAMKEVSAERIKATIEKLVSFHTRYAITARDESMAKSNQGVVAASDWIKAELERYSQLCGGCLQVKTDYFVQPEGFRITDPTPMINVYAVLRGTDPERSKEIYLVTGHYDSIALAPRPGTAGPRLGPMEPDAFAPGANDDASGTAVSLECARVLSKYKFPATIIFLAVDGEEEGLYGSAHFAELAQEENWNLRAVLNNDIVGGDTTPGRPGQNYHVVRIFSEGVPLMDNPADIYRIRDYGWESDSTSRELARYVRQVARTYFATGTFEPELIFRADRYGRGGDHTSFNRYGYAAVRLTEYHENPNHQHLAVHKENEIQYGDLPEFVNFAYVANVARLNAATLAALAMAPPSPDKVTIDARGQEDPTRLSWGASPGATTYEVVWRATTAPEWEHSQNVGNVTNVTMPYSKDNIIYGVRAVDAKGHRSLVVLPKPPTLPAPPWEVTPRRSSGQPGPALPRY